MAPPKLTTFLTPGAHAEEIEHGWRLSIPSGNADKYRNAQVHDYARLPRRQFPHRFPLDFSLLARTSNDSIPGTWGFGLWNDPFGLSLGFGGNPLRLPALPNAVWFFGASPENYLSFGSSTAASRTPANGFIAQEIRSPKFHPLLILAGLAFPFSRKTTRRLFGKIIGEDGIALRVNPTEWHKYSFTWEEKQVAFHVDDVQTFESTVSPNPPLGLVIWIDNQFAAFTPEGKIGFGILANPEPVWLEVKDLEIL